jgi:hypothetical protein
MDVLNAFNCEEFFQVFFAIELVKSKHFNEAKTQVREDPFDEIFSLLCGHIRERMAQVIVSYLCASRLQVPRNGPQSTAKCQGDATRQKA